MNAHFIQWVKENFELTALGGDIVQKVYLHLQANPHLLREDGEKEQSYGKFMLSNPPIPTDEGVLNSEGATDIPKPEYFEKLNLRPTDMEQEAREMRKLHCTTLLGLTDILTGSAMLKINTEIETALTEFGKMWYERGRDHYKDSYEHYFHEYIELVKDFESAHEELTDAKEQIAKLEQQNADLEMALKNL